MKTSLRSVAGTAALACLALLVLSPCSDALSDNAKALLQQAQRTAFVVKGVDAIRKCRVANGVSEDDLRAEVQKSMQSHQVPTSRSGQCFMACMGEEFNLMKDGAFNPEGAQHLLDKWVEIGPPSFSKLTKEQIDTIYSEAKRAIDTCGQSAGTGQDSCETAAALMQCAVNVGERLRERLLSPPLTA